MKLLAVITTFYIFITLCSCSHLSNDCSYGIKVRLVNKSADNVNIEVKALGGTPLKVLLPAKPNERDTTLCFDHVAKQDGDYYIHIKKKAGLDTTFYWGYYSNGAPLGSRIDITVYPDTFTLNELF